MKYTFEATETEVTELYGLLGLIAKEVGKTVRHNNELRFKRPQPPVVVTHSDTAEDIGIDDESDTDDNGDVLPFIRPAPEPVRKTEQEIEDEIVSEPEPLPREVVLKQKSITLGKTKFTEFIQSWMAGIDYETMGLVEGVVQPNRELLLRDLCNSPFAHPTLEYVRSCGGLQRAIFDVTQDKYLARRLPDFIVPPASIVFSDLSDTYEYTNPWKDEE